MQSKKSIKKYFFVILILFIGIIITSLYLFFNEPYSRRIQIFFIIFCSYFINVFSINGIEFEKKGQLLAILIYSVLFISSLQIFSSLTIGWAYLCLSLVLLLVLDNFDLPSTLKYFNMGMLTALAVFFYPPIFILMIVFFLITIFFYEKINNIPQYLLGIAVTLLLILEVSFLINHMDYLIAWYRELCFPEFKVSLQIPMVLILLFVLFYAWFNQHTNTHITENITVSNIHFTLILYLLGWIVVYIFFMNVNYGLLVFVSLPVGILIGKNIYK